MVTPWFPTRENPAGGSFVQASVLALSAHRGEPVPIVHVKVVQPGEPESVLRSQHPAGPLVTISVPSDPMRPRLEAAQALGDALRRHLPAEISDADVLHVHAGMPGGVAVLPVVRPEQRLVMTEHASYLRRVFEDPQARAAYGEVLGRCALVSTVSDSLRHAIAAAFPEVAAGGRLVTIPNPVAIEEVPTRPDAPDQLLSWLVVSNLIPRKSVDRTLRVFAAWSSVRPGSRLTIVGDGPEREQLEKLAVELGIADVVRFLGALPHEDVLRTYAEHDVLVHLSRFETFGVVLAEALSAQIRVVGIAGAAEMDLLREAVPLGTAVTVGIDDDEAAVVAAIARLEGPGRGADIALAAARVRERFSARRVGAALAALVAGELPPTDDGVGVRAVVLADRDDEIASAARVLNLCSVMGVRCDLVATERAKVRGLPVGQRVVRVKPRGPLRALQPPEELRGESYDLALVDGSRWAKLAGALSDRVASIDEQSVLSAVASALRSRTAQSGGRPGL